MAGLGTTESAVTPNASNMGCGSRLNGFVQLVLSTLISGFILLLGIGIVQISPAVYNILKPTGAISNQPILSKVHEFVSWLLTLLLEGTGYALMILAAFVLILSVVFFIRCIISVPYYSAV